MQGKIDMSTKFTSKEKKPEQITNKDDSRLEKAIFEYKGPEPEGPRPIKGKK